MNNFYQCNNGKCTKYNENLNANIGNIYINKSDCEEKCTFARCDYDKQECVFDKEANINDYDVYKNMDLCKKECHKFEINDIFDDIQDNDEELKLFLNNPAKIINIIETLFVTSTKYYLYITKMLTYNNISKSKQKQFLNMVHTKIEISLSKTK